jgi:hypothetical protein
MVNKGHNRRALPFTIALVLCCCTNATTDPEPQGPALPLNGEDASAAGVTGMAGMSGGLAGTGGSGGSAEVAGSAGATSGAPTQPLPEAGLSDSSVSPDLADGSGGAPDSGRLDGSADVDGAVDSGLL